MATAFLCAAYFFLGLISITVQVLTVREFMVVFFGNELCLGIILGGWLIGIALGSGSGGRITRRVTRIFPLFMLLQAALCLLPFFQICTIRLIRGILNRPSRGIYQPPSSYHRGDSHHPSLQFYHGPHLSVRMHTICSA